MPEVPWGTHVSAPPVSPSVDWQGSVIAATAGSLAPRALWPDPAVQNGTAQCCWWSRPVG